MAVKKSTKKTPSKKAPKKVLRTTKSRTISFFIGIITVTLIALAILGIAQGKNYKNVLGTQTTQQDSSR